MGGKKLMKDRQIVDLLLNKESETISRFHNAINEILRVGYETNRGKQVVPDLIESLRYLLEDIERIVSR